MAKSPKNPTAENSDAELDQPAFTPDERTPDDIARDALVQAFDSRIQQVTQSIDQGTIELKNHFTQEVKDWNDNFLAEKKASLPPGSPEPKLTAVQQNLPGQLFLREDGLEYDTGIEVNDTTLKIRERVISLQDQRWELDGIRNGIATDSKDVQVDAGVSQKVHDLARQQAAENEKVKQAQENKAALLEREKELQARTRDRNPVQRAFQKILVPNSSPAELNRVRQQLKDENDNISKAETRIREIENQLKSTAQMAVPKLAPPQSVAQTVQPTPQAPSAVISQAQTTAPAQGSPSPAGWQSAPQQSRPRAAASSSFEMGGQRRTERPEGLTVQNLTQISESLQAEIRKVETTLATIQTQIDDPQMRASSSSSNAVQTEKEQSEELEQRKAEKLEALNALQTELAETQQKIAEAQPALRTAATPSTVGAILAPDPVILPESAIDTGLGNLGYPNGPASSPSPSQEKSITGRSPQDLIAKLDEQSAQLQRLQDRDAAVLATLPEGPARAPLKEQMEMREVSMAINDKLKSRLNQGEHPTLVENDMVNQRVTLVDSMDRKNLQQAAAAMRAPNSPPTLMPQQTPSASTPILRVPPPSTLPPLPDEVQAPASNQVPVDPVQPSRLPPSPPQELATTLTADQELDAPARPSYAPPPPPVDPVDDLSASQSVPSPSPMPAAATPVRQGGVTLTPQQIDRIITRDFDKPSPWSPGSDVGSSPARNDPSKYDSYSRTFDDSTGLKPNKLDGWAVEIRMIETLEIEPRQQHIDNLEQQLGDLQKIHGEQSSRPEIAALNEELNQLYDELDVFETRVASLKESLKNDLPKDRLTAINQEQQALNESVAQKASVSKVQFGGDVKALDGNPRQEHELTVSASKTAQTFAGKVPEGGITPDDLAKQIKESYKKAYQYEGPDRVDEEGKQLHVKAANDRRITPAEIDRIAADMKPVVDQVNVLQAQIEVLKADANGLGTADKIQDLQTQQTQLLEGYRDQKMAQADAIKPDRVKESPGLEANSYDRKATPDQSSFKAGKELETNTETLQKAAQRQQRVDELTAPEPTLLEKIQYSAEEKVDSLKQAVHQLKGEERLRDLDQGIQDNYKDLQTKIKDPTLTESSKIQIEKQIADLKTAHPELEQLDRSKVGRNLHSGLRDAVQAVDSLKEKITHPGDTLKDVRSQLKEGVKSLKEGLGDSLPDRLKVMTIDHDLKNMDKKITDLKSQRDQLVQGKETFERNVAINSSVSGPGDFPQQEGDAIVKKNLMELYEVKEDTSLDELRQMGDDKMAAIDAQLEKMESEIKKAETQVEALKEQKDAIKNKKDISQDSSQSIKQKM